MIPRTRSLVRRHDPLRIQGLPVKSAQDSGHGFWLPSPATETICCSSVGRVDARTATRPRDCDETSPLPTFRTNGPPSAFPSPIHISTHTSTADTQNFPATNIRTNGWPFPFPSAIHIFTHTSTADTHNLPLPEFLANDPPFPSSSMSTGRHLATTADPAADPAIIESAHTQNRLIEALKEENAALKEQLRGTEELVEAQEEALGRLREGFEAEYEAAQTTAEGKKSGRKRAWFKAVWEKAKADEAAKREARDNT